MNRSIGFFLLNISTALYLFATGILGLYGPRFFKDSGEIHKAVTGVFGPGDFSNILIVVLGICAIAAGVFILLKLFSLNLAIIELILCILMIIWVIFIFLADIIPLFRNSWNIVDFLRSIGSHIMILGGIALVSEHFGG
jgi:hypothetical protein